MPDVGMDCFMVSLGSWFGFTEEKILIAFLGQVGVFLNYYSH
jgi:hypothetical protein